MGLDVVAYRGLTLLADASATEAKRREDEEFGWYDGQVKVCHGPFSYHAQPLEDGAVYTYEEAFSGPSIGYYWYTRWCEELAKMVASDKREFLHSAGYPQESDALRHFIAQNDHGPFSEFLYFGCEGFIGAPLCVKLAKDFAAFDDLAKALDNAALEAQGGFFVGSLPKGENWFYRRYAEFRQAFEFAAQSPSGCVRFF